MITLHFVPLLHCCGCSVITLLCMFLCYIAMLVSLFDCCFCFIVTQRCPFHYYTAVCSTITRRECSITCRPGVKKPPINQSLVRCFLFRYYPDVCFIITFIFLCRFCTILLFHYDIAIPIPLFTVVPVPLLPCRVCSVITLPRLFPSETTTPVPLLPACLGERVVTGVCGCWWVSL